MFFNTMDFTVKNIEVFKLTRDQYRKAAGERPFHAISFRLSGEAKYELGDETIATKPGDILYVPAYAKYTKDTDAEQFYVVHFRSDELHGDKPLRITPVSTEEYRNLFIRMYNAHKEKRFAYEHECKYLLYQLLMKIEREQIEKKSIRYEDEIRKALSLMHENYLKPEFTIQTILSQLYMSETYFRRQFCKMVGKSPKKYISDLRLEHAIQLLESGYYSISEVAQKCGFANAYYFSAFIKRATGSSPKAHTRDMHNTSQHQEKL